MKPAGPADQAVYDEIARNYWKDTMTDTTPKAPAEKPTRALALQLAAQVWCAETTKHIVMDPALAEEFAKVLEGWLDCLAYSEKGCEYFRGQLRKCGEHIGIEAYTSDDGSVQQDVLAAKVPELVAAMVETLKFVERWAVHHGSHPRITPQEALSMIQHYPRIKAITKSYHDSKVPETFDPYARIHELEALLGEVADQYTRDDDLPNNLLPRIDAALPERSIPTPAAVAG